jgi:hypothetical protein
VIKAVQTSQADRSKTQTEWLDPATLDKTQIKTDFPPSQSIASDGAEVAKVKDCLVFRDKSVGSPRNICCHDECGRGVPLFLDNSEILSVYGGGFEVLSTDGGILWKREATARALTIGTQHSLDGNRFAIALARYSQDTKFEEKNIPKDYAAIYVYDSSLRQSVGNASIKYSGREFAFALSPSGQTLALLTGDTVYLYEFAK